MALVDWSITAADNDTITDATYGNINFAEGQAPDSLNNSARSLMAHVRAWYNGLCPLVSVSSNTSLTVDHANGLVLCDTTGGNVTVTLPAIAGTSGRLYIIKKSVAANVLTITAQAGELINETLTLTMDLKGSTVVIVSDGTIWDVIVDTRLVHANMYLNASDFTVSATDSLVKVPLDAVSNFGGGTVASNLYTPPTDGLYLIRYGISYTGVTSGVVQASPSIDAGTNFYDGILKYVYTAVANNLTLHGTEIIRLEKTAQVGLYALKSDASNDMVVNAISAPRNTRYTHLSVTRLNHNEA